MIGVEPIEKLMKVALASGRVWGEKPLSLIIVAAIESGKTSMIRQHCRKIKTVFYTSDATAYGIIRDTNQLSDFASRKLTHIVIPDFLACVSRKQDTVRSLISFLSALIEEGVVNINTYATQLQGKLTAKAGIITAITPDAFRDRRHRWGRVGFLSRALPVSYSYKKETQRRIFQFIQDQKYLKKVIEGLNLPEMPRKILLDPKLAKEIEPHAKELAVQQSDIHNIYGFRYQMQLQTFVKAIALLEGKNKVDQECIDELERLLEYINLEFNKI
jgi:hypothetical protein